MFVQIKAPHEIVESGGLGARCATAALLASSSANGEDVAEGIELLRECVKDEEKRKRKLKNLGLLSKEEIAGSNTKSNEEESPDALRLRLTLIRALIRARKEDDALHEADATRRLYPKSPAAAIWHGRVALRKCDRQAASAAFIYAGAEAKISDVCETAGESLAKEAARKAAEKEEFKKKTNAKERLLVDDDDDAPELEDVDDDEENELKGVCKEDEELLRKHREEKENQREEELAMEKEQEKIEEDKRKPFCYEGPDRCWARSEAAKKLTLVRKMERGERRGKDQYGRGLFKEAAEFYTEALEAANELLDDRWARARLLTERAACYRRNRDLGKAIKDLNESLKLFPCYKRALFRKGVCLLENQQADLAVAAFETLMGLDREWENLLDWLVRAHALDRRISKGGGPSDRAKKGFYPENDYGYNNDGQFRGEMPVGQKMGGNWAQAPGERDIALEKDHYAVLGVSQDATEKQIKRAYRTMSLKYHPDKETGSTRAFQRIALAYQTLSDPEKRQLYDDGADLNMKQGDGADDDDDVEEENKKQSLREEIERKYFPERYKFFPFGDPFVEKRKREERKKQRSGGRAWHENPF